MFLIDNAMKQMGVCTLFPTLNEIIKKKVALPKCKACRKSITL